MRTAVTFLDVLWNEAPLIERMVNTCLVHEEIERHPIELDDDELQITGTLMCARVPQRVAADRVDHYFAAHRDDFDCAHVARIERGDETIAQRIYRATAGHADYAELAREGASRVVFERVRRCDIQEFLRAVLFQSSPGDVLPPTRVGERFGGEQILFDEWLAERRSAARVCWHWGNPERAPSAA